MAHDIEPEAPVALAQNQVATKHALQKLPAMRARYHHLIDAFLALRHQQITAAERAQAHEQLLAQALRQPGSVAQGLELTTGIHPVICWLQPQTATQSH